MARASRHGTLTASTVATVTVSGDYRTVDVWNLTGTAAIYFTLDGSTPTVQGNDTFVVPAAVGSVRLLSPAVDTALTVKLISSGTPSYSVVTDASEVA